ncbi:MAG: hypothetical protein EHM72_16405 [Calditrichaeota bacterium]|nr:MAG: hypothetical protein EHM72_16405 [Calditrichota bacterium]
MIKGKNLQNAVVLVEDPELTFTILENRNDLIRLVAVAGPHTVMGQYSLEIRIQEVSFQFKEYSITVQPWQPFREFIAFNVTSCGDLPPEECFTGSGKHHAIETHDAITVRLSPDKIGPEFGRQKVYIHGMLTDSSNTIRAEAFDSRMITVEPGEGVITWRWRVRDRIRAGDRIEISLRNPGNQNRITEYFVVVPHWSEAFHGSTSFVLFKLPIGSSAQKTQILNSIGLGISYQPFLKKRFFECDASFIVGNAKTEQNDMMVEVNFGLSAIFWQYLQVGVGSNLTGTAFSRAFMFVGTRFKLPISF